MGCVTQKQSKPSLSKTQTIETCNRDDAQENQELDRTSFQIGSIEQKRKEITKQIMEETGLKGKEYVQYVVEKFTKSSQKSALSAQYITFKQQLCQPDQVRQQIPLREMVFLMKSDEIIEDQPVQKEYRQKITVLKYGNNY